MVGYTFNLILILFVELFQRGPELPFFFYILAVIFTDRTMRWRVCTGIVLHATGLADVKGGRLHKEVVLGL
jgi:hypothetical protein